MANPLSTLNVEDVLFSPVRMILAVLTFLASIHFLDGLLMLQLLLLILLPINNSNLKQCSLSCLSFSFWCLSIVIWLIEREKRTGQDRTCCRQHNNGLKSASPNYAMSNYPAPNPAFFVSSSVRAELSCNLTAQFSLEKFV